MHAHCTDIWIYKFCEKTGMDPEESKIAHLSRPIIEIMATEDGFRETIILPNADNEILDTFHYVFGQKLTTFDRSVTARWKFLWKMIRLLFKII